jgi:hypothetical protein
MVRALSYMHTFYEWERKMKDADPARTDRIGSVVDEQLHGANYEGSWTWRQELDEIKTALNVFRVETNERLRKLEDAAGFNGIPHIKEKPLELTWRECNNFQAGRYKDVSTIVYHYTAGTSNAEAIVKWWNTLKSPKRVSAHYIIDRDGSITWCVAEKDTAWHAWRYNPESIGIEICAASVEDRRATAEDKRMTEKQEEALAKLTKDIMSRHQINLITGHGFFVDINTSCPGHVFPTVGDIDIFLDKWGILV